MGVKVTPQQVAEAAWRAVHGNRSHWRVGADARLITNWVARLLGSKTAAVSAGSCAAEVDGRQRARHEDRGRRRIESLRRQSAAPDAPGVEPEHAGLLDVTQGRPVPEDQALPGRAAPGDPEPGLCSGGAVAGGPLNLRRMRPSATSQTRSRVNALIVNRNRSQPSSSSRQSPAVAIHVRTVSAARRAVDARPRAAQERAVCDVPLRRQSGMEQGEAELRVMVQQRAATAASRAGPRRSGASTIGRRPSSRRRQPAPPRAIASRCRS